MPRHYHTRHPLKDLTSLQAFRQFFLPETIHKKSGYHRRSTQIQCSGNHRRQAVNSPMTGNSRNFCPTCLPFKMRHHIRRHTIRSDMVNQPEISGRVTVKRLSGKISERMRMQHRLSVHHMDMHIKRKRTDISGKNHRKQKL